MKQKTTRQSKVASEIRKVVSEFITRNAIVESKNSPTVISVTDVEVSPCLQHAKIFVSYVSNSLKDDELLESLAKQTPKIRFHIGKEIKLRFVPEIKFFLDDTFEKAQKIDALLESIHEKSSIN